MLDNVEEIAIESGLLLKDQSGSWSCTGDAPHIMPFTYEVSRADDETESDVVVGTITGYRIAHNWTVDDERVLWDEADSLDGDVVRYVDALIRELRAFGELEDLGPDLTSAQRVTILRHVEPVNVADHARLTVEAAASLGMMDAPVMMLVDPWPMAEERATAKGKLKGRGAIPGLLALGFQRMVGSRFVWAWDRNLSETLMSTYSYEALLKAKNAGKLDGILRAPLHGMPPAIALLMGLPSPDDTDEE